MISRLFRSPVERKPLRPLPAISLAIDRAHSCQPIIQRAGSPGPPVRLFLARQARGEGQAVVEEHLRARVGFVGERAIPARVELDHVDLGVALNHPLRQIFPCAAPLRDPERRSATMPEIAQARGGPKQRPAVGRVRDRAIDDPPDADFAEHRHSFDRALDPPGDAVEVVGEQLAGRFPLGDSLGRPRFLKLDILVDADQPAILFLPEIA